MNATTQPGPLEVRLSDQLGRISPTALRRFDALGGSAQWTDAKDRWDDQ